MENLLFFRNLQIFLSLEEVFELLALRPSPLNYSFIIYILSTPVNKAIQKPFDFEFVRVGKIN